MSSTSLFAGRSSFSFPFGDADVLLASECVFCLWCLPVRADEMLVRPATLLFCWPELRSTCCWSILLAASTYRVLVRFPSNSEEIYDSLTVCSTAFSTLLCPEGADDFTATAKFYAYQAALAGNRNFVRSCEICCAALLSLGKNAGSWARSCHLGPAGASACADRQLHLLRSLLLQAPSAFEKDFGILMDTLR